ncbi:MAG: hypothetical protein DSM106950_26365 [Stigonema ocellatum SAG 48.90 = DSM 106950]|nr:hypothetical protein [Stigonema ocellatum SAG 48.90 = DSM 106950]
MMNFSPDRLYELLPAVYRIRDAEQGYALRDLLRVIAEQVDVVEGDIAQLYDNWFIETCQDWVVPYIGDLIDYQSVPSAGQLGNATRRFVANTIRYRRRKGTLALLELLAYEVAGWQARVVEFYKFLNNTQNINHLGSLSQTTVDLRQVDALDKLDSPFDELAHAVDIRRIASQYSPGSYNIPSIGVFVCRLKAYSVTRTPAYCLEEVSPNCYTFSVTANDIPLYTHPEPEEDSAQTARELNLPIPIQRRVLQSRMSDYYNPIPEKFNKSLEIWVGNGSQVLPVPIEKIIVADLSDWSYQPPKDHIAVDPELGRIIFPRRQLPKNGVWVSYHYGFSADIGGGEYDRPLLNPDEIGKYHEYALYKVSQNSTENYQTITEAILQWQREKPRHAVIEIIDSGVYVEQIDIQLESNQTLQLRAANRMRPVIRILDWRTSYGDALNVTVKPGSSFTLDGLLITGRGVHVEGVQGIAPLPAPVGSVIQKPPQLVIRHCTLVPGWSLHCDCEPRRSTEPSLELCNTDAHTVIEHSIVGSIEVNQDEVQTDPLPIHIYDTIVANKH